LESWGGVKTVEKGQKTDARKNSMVPKQGKGAQKGSLGHERKTGVKMPTRLKTKRIAAPGTGEGWRVHYHFHYAQWGGEGGGHEE